MHAVYGMTTFHETDPARARQAFDAFEQRLRQQPGYVTTYWLFNEPARRYGFLQLWESAEAAQAAAAGANPQGRLAILAEHGFVPDDTVAVRESFEVYQAAR